MKYRVCETDEVFDDVEDVLDNCIDDDWHQDDDDFEDWVNDKYGYIEIYGDTYYAYDILSNMAEGDLDSLRDDFCEEKNDRDRDDAEYQLEHAEIGDYVEIQRYSVEIIADEDEDDNDIETDVQSVRIRIEQERKFQAEQVVKDNENEKDLMQVFQIVGG